MVHLDGTNGSEHPHLRLVRDYFSALEQRREEAELAAFFLPEVRQREFPNRLVEKGAERDLGMLLAGSRKGRQVVENEQYAIRSGIVSGDRVAVEITWTAQLKVQLGAQPPGSTLRADCGVFFRVRDGRIAEQHNYDCFAPF